MKSMIEWFNIKLYIMDETTMDENIEIALKGGEFKRLLEYQFNIIKSTYGLKKVDIDVLFFLSNCNSENTPTDT